MTPRVGRGRGAPMAFEETIRRWAREQAVSWTAFPLDETSSEREMRVGYTVRLYARPRVHPAGTQRMGAPSAPEARLRALGLCLLGCERRAAGYHVDLAEEPPLPGSPPKQSRELVLILRVRLRPEWIVSTASAEAECAGDVARRLRAMGAPERP